MQQLKLGQRLKRRAIYTIFFVAQILCVAITIGVYGYALYASFLLNTSSTSSLFYLDRIIQGILVLIPLIPCVLVISCLIPSQHKVR